MGLFHPFLDDPSVEIFGVEAAGHGLTNLHAASIAGGRPGVLHGNRTYLLMDDDGQIQEGHSISAGSIIPASAPNIPGCMKPAGDLSLRDRRGGAGRVPAAVASRRHHSRTGARAAIAKVMELAPKRPKDHLMVVNLSGRGDKDVPQVGDILKGKRSDHAHRHTFRRTEEGRPRGVRDLRDVRRPGLATCLRSSRRCRKPVRMSSSLACRSPIRWPMVQRFRPPAAR
jgi:hypothetical protein